MAEQIITKQCSKCNQIKPLSEFHRDKSKKDRHTPHCKSCRLIKMVEYQKTEKGTEVNRKAGARHRIRFPERQKARNAVSNSIRDGKLPRPETQKCHYCPTEDTKQAEQYHHWKGYAKKHWLDVIPVCLKCHSSVHKAIVSVA